MKNIFTLSANSKRAIRFALILITLFGCNKDSIQPQGAKIVVEGVVFEDCDGSLVKGQEIILNNLYSGCFGSGITSQEITYTDNNGHFKFEYRENMDKGSTLRNYYQLTIPNSLISIVNPSGDIHIFPNDTIMNAVIRLKFQNKYTAKDTFYYQFKSSPKGYIERVEQIQFLVGPFNDTTIKLNNLRIGNSNNVSNGKFYCGEFKWGIGKLGLNSYYTGQDGSFYLTHKPCGSVDEFEYYVSAN